jgi:transcriptional regulator with XRE-family HTH domain
MALTDDLAAERSTDGCAVRRKRPISLAGQHSCMASRETRLDRGRGRGRKIRARVLGEIKVARTVANLSQQDVARTCGWTRSRYARFERGDLDDVGIQDLAIVCAVLGLGVSVGLHPEQEADRDRGHSKLRQRFTAFRTARYARSRRCCCRELVTVERGTCC